MAVVLLGRPDSNESQLFLNTFASSLSKTSEKSKYYHIEFTKEVEDFIKNNFKTWKIRIHNDKIDYYSSDRYNCSVLAFNHYKKYGDVFKESINKIIKLEDYYTSEETNGKIYGYEWQIAIDNIMYVVNNEIVEDIGKFKRNLECKLFDLHECYLAPISVFEDKDN